MSVLGNEEQVGPVLVDAVAFRANVDPFGVVAHDIFERSVVVASRVRVEFVAEIEAGKCNRAAGVFFLNIAIKVSRVADLRFDFFLAVAEIVVGNQRHDDAFRRAARQLERLAAVVKFVLAVPAHSIFTLPRCRVVDVRKSDLLLRNGRQVRGENHTASLSGPVLDIETRVVVRKVRVASVAENRLDEIQIRYERTRREETNFHSLFHADARHFRADQRSQQQ